jgi:hypothetical protein
MFTKYRILWISYNKWFFHNIYRDNVKLWFNIISQSNNSNG